LASVDKGDGSTAPVQQYFIWYRPVGGEWLKLEVDAEARGALLDNLSEFFVLRFETEIFLSRHFMPIKQI
jgi:hypothetical protein